MDNSKLISQAKYARVHLVSPQWISHCIKEGFLAAVNIAGIPYVRSDAKIKIRKKKTTH